MAGWKAEMGKRIESPQAGQLGCEVPGQLCFKQKVKGTWEPYLRLSSDFHTCVIHVHTCTQSPLPPTHVHTQLLRHTHSYDKDDLEQMGRK